MQAPAENATAAPTLAPMPAEAQRIRFPRGATRATINDYVDTYDTVSDVLSAREGQVMRVALQNRRGLPSRVYIFAEDRSMLGSVSAGESSAFTLPATQDYYLLVYAHGRGHRFALWVQIPP
jgi:hypothetical protein